MKESRNAAFFSFAPFHASAFFTPNSTEFLTEVTR